MRSGNLLCATRGKQDFSGDPKRTKPKFPCILLAKRCGSTEGNFKNSPTASLTLRMTHRGDVGQGCEKASSVSRGLSSQSDDKHRSPGEKAFWTLAVWYVRLPQRGCPPPIRPVRTNSKPFQKVLKGGVGDAFRVWRFCLQNGGVSPPRQTPVFCRRQNHLA